MGASGAWIPAGRSMSGRNNLWIVAADGGFPTQLTVSDQRQTSPAWDSSGGYGDQTVKVTVKQGVSVNITTPKNGSSDNSPVKVSANASSANAIKGWEIYVDSVPTFNQGGGSQINTSLSLRHGSHSLMVRAWDTSNAYGDQTVKISVP